MNSTAFDEPRKILSVSQLNRLVRNLIETNLGSVWIEGEISNFSCPNSGHWYLTIKDNNAQVRCAMFKNNNSKVKFKPSDGKLVLLNCNPGIYEARGEFQVVINSMEEAGLGDLQRKFERLKKRLNDEALFDTKFKKKIPQNCNTVGIITSPTGAAVRDILSIMNRRFPLTKVLIYPCLVQGSEAAAQIKDNIILANLQNYCDVLIISRGGGSIEDLWSFNDEQVAREIFKSKLPIISAVGHEIDFTIADFVSDLRAPTPSAAAEIITRDQSDLNRVILASTQQLLFAIRRYFAEINEKIANKKRLLADPRRQLQDKQQYLDQIEIRLNRSFTNLMINKKYLFESKFDRINKNNPKKNLEIMSTKIRAAIDKATICLNLRILEKTKILSNLTKVADAMNPGSILDRGYSILQNKNKQVITSVKMTVPAETLSARMSDGSIQLRVLDDEKKLRKN